jgi:hypothetical protein
MDLRRRKWKETREDKHNEEFCNLYSLPRIIREQNKRE